MIKEVLDLINLYNPRALYTVEAIKYVNKKIFHKSEEERQRWWMMSHLKR
jgi:hypothetical protein